jgi:hypothetical protein
MTRKRTDANQQEIVDALRKVGATVQCLHMVGCGCPDLLVGYHHKNYLLEVKVPKEGLNKREGEWHEEWNGDVKVVWTAQEALYEIGALK